jgi:hypothetical protein
MTTLFGEPDALGAIFCRTGASGRLARLLFMALVVIRPTKLSIATIFASISLASFYKKRHFAVSGARNCIFGVCHLSAMQLQYLEIKHYYLVAPSLLKPDKNGGAL